MSTHTHADRPQASHAHPAPPSGAAYDLEPLEERRLLEAVPAAGAPPLDDYDYGPAVPDDRTYDLTPAVAMAGGGGQAVRAATVAAVTVAAPAPEAVLSLRASADAHARDGTYAGTNFGSA